MTSWLYELVTADSFRKITKNVYVYNQLLILLDGNTQTPLFMGPQCEVLEFIESFLLRHVLNLSRVDFSINLAVIWLPISLNFRKNPLSINPKSKHFSVKRHFSVSCCCKRRPMIPKWKFIRLDKNVLPTWNQIFHGSVYAFWFLCI